MKKKNVLTASDTNNPMQAQFLANPRTARLHALVDGTLLHESSTGHRSSRLPSPEAILDDGARAFAERLHEAHARRTRGH